LIRLQLAELVALETIRIQFPDTTHTATRSIYLRETLRDTLFSTSIELRSDSVSGVSQTVQTGPLTVQSDKGGKRGFAPGSFLIGLIIFVIFVVICALVKKYLVLLQRKFPHV